MICCEEGVEYIPHGRLVMSSHPGLEYKKNNKKEWWSIVEHDGLEEEVYINNRTVVWSRGHAGASNNAPDSPNPAAENDDETDTYRDGKSDFGRTVVCTLTVESKVKQALFTTFYTYPDKPAMLAEHVEDHPTGSPLYSLCILEQEYITVFTESGDEFNIALPFAVEKAWSIWYGLLLQRKVNSKETEPPHPLLFSLLHPLEEISPLNQKTGSSNAMLPCYGTDLEQSVIMTSHYPSLAITYSAKYNSVSVWRTRRCNMEENAAMVHNCSAADTSKLGTAGCSLLTAPTTQPLNQSFCPPPSPAPPLQFTPSHNTSINHASLHFTPSTHQKQTFHHLTPSAHFHSSAIQFTPNIHHRHSPFTSFHSNQSFLAASPAGLTPVLPRRSPATVRTPVNARLRSVMGVDRLTTPRPHRAQGMLFAPSPSPSCLSQQARLGPSPSPGRTPRSTLPRTPAPSILNQSRGEVEPLIPDLCMELLWTDQTAGRPYKAFLSEDAVGQRFMCLALQGTLRLIKYEHTNDLSSLVFGSCSFLPAKDAEPLPALRMILLLDEAGALTLYSGLTNVCRINVTQSTQLLNTTLFRDFSSLNISSQILGSALETPQRRSSLITGGRVGPSALDKLEVPFSPVVSMQKPTEQAVTWEQSSPSSTPQPAVKGLHDPTVYRVTIEHTDGLMRRISLPELCSSSLVSRILTAFKYVLPREVALQFIAKWYSTRNSLGSGDFSAQGEWLLFSRTLLTHMGYDTDKLQATCPVEPPGSRSPVVVQKKVKTTESGSDKDWDYVLSSQYHRQTNAVINEVLSVGWVSSIADEYTEAVDYGLNVSAPLFTHMHPVFFALHLVYEELKCCTLYWDLCALLVPCLAQLAADLREKAYQHHYWKDFPTLCSADGPAKHLSDENFPQLVKPGYFYDNPPCFQSTLTGVIKKDLAEEFPYIPEVCSLIKSVMLIFCMTTSDCGLDNVIINKYLRRIGNSGQKGPEERRTVFVHGSQNALTIDEKIVLLTDSLGLTNLDVQLLAPGISLLLMNAQHRCRLNPPLGWHCSAYELINRPDMVRHTQQAAEYAKRMFELSQDAYSAPPQYDGFRTQPGDDTKPEPADDDTWDKIDGMETLNWAVIRLRWPSDKRMKEVRQMLNSSTPTQIEIKQRTEVSDQEYLDEQKRFLYSLCIRTMALPIGRGMLTISSTTPIITETLGIPPLTLTGKGARGTTIDLQNIEVPANMNIWPLFHNGVAAALTIFPSSEDINTSWILYNRPKGPSNEQAVDHAGFLLGLGLNGHIRNLSTVGLHEYLSRAHELTSVGLLLGLAAARRGTCHAATTKLLSIHLECLLPPTCTELDIHHTVQVASILGIGLLYQGSGHRHMAEVLLREIGRPPGPEMENSNDRESYSLAAGLGLGLVMFGKGNEPEQFADLDIAGQLYHYIEGGYQKPVTGPTRDKYKSPSYQIKEGKRVNIDVTSPGATLALGMIYFNSGNKAVAKWMVTPHTTYLLDQIRPDFLLLRTVALGMIMWSDVKPTPRWVDKNIPVAIMRTITDYEESRDEGSNIDFETLYQDFFHLTAGACLVLGLKFAGTSNHEAFDTVYKYTSMLYRYSKNTNITILSGKSCVESCLVVSLLALSLVMAGTGDLEVLRFIRTLRDRVGPHSAYVGYGSHVALHMALGFLFLGGGRLSLACDGLSVAALLIACYPKMPHHSGDNRYHLQAFRHLYAVACEPRLLMPVDVDTGRICSAAITLNFNKDFPPVPGFDVVAPYVLPQLYLLEEVIIEAQAYGNRYWPIRFVRGTSSWAVLEALLKSSGGIAVKLRDGEVPYPAEDGIPGDPRRTRSGAPMETQEALLNERSPPWIAQSAALAGVRGARATRLLKVLVGDTCCPDGLTTTPSSPHQEDDEGHDALHLLLKAVVYDHLRLGKPEAIASWLTVIQGVKKVSEMSRHCGLLVWQVKTIDSVATFLALIINRDAVAMIERAEEEAKAKATGEAMEEEGGGSDENTDPRRKLGAGRLPQYAGYAAYKGLPGAADGGPRPLVAPDQALSLRGRLVKLIDSWAEEVAADMGPYLIGDTSVPYSPKTALLLRLLDVPAPNPNAVLRPNSSRLLVARRLHMLGVSPVIIQALVSTPST